MILFVFGRREIRRKDVASTAMDYYAGRNARGGLLLVLHDIVCLYLFCKYKEQS